MNLHSLVSPHHFPASRKTRHCIVRRVASSPYPRSSSFCPTSTSAMVSSCLVVSAIATVEGYARLQCWKLGNFTAIELAGGLLTYSLNLGSFGNTTFSVIPPRLTATTHNAPRLQ